MHSGDSTAHHSESAPPDGPKAPVGDPHVAVALQQEEGPQTTRFDPPGATLRDSTSTPQFAGRTRAPRISLKGAKSQNIPGHTSTLSDACTQPAVPTDSSAANAATGTTCHRVASTSSEPAIAVIGRRETSASTSTCASAFADDSEGQSAATDASTHARQLGPSERRTEGCESSPQLSINGDSRRTGAQPVPCAWDLSDCNVWMVSCVKVFSAWHRDATFLGVNTSGVLSRSQLPFTATSSVHTSSRRRSEAVRSSLATPGRLHVLCGQCFQTLRQVGPASSGLMRITFIGPPCLAAGASKCQVATAGDGRRGRSRSASVRCVGAMLCATLVQLWFRLGRRVLGGNLSTRLPARSEVSFKYSSQNTMRRTTRQWCPVSNVLWLCLGVRSVPENQNLDNDREALRPRQEAPNMLDTFDNATVWRPERPEPGAPLDTWKDYLDNQLDSLAMRDVLGGLVLLPGLQNRVHGGVARLRSYRAG